MSVDSDSGLIKSFIMVLGGLVVFTVFIMFLARVVAPPETYDDKLISESLQKRIAPVGQVRTAANAGDTAATDEVAGAPKTAQELYDGVCASCHATGVADAPKPEDTAEWAKRGEAGVDALVATVISGKGAMPPKGGSAYTDEEIKSVVELLLGQGGAEAPAAAEEAPADEAPAETAEAAPAAAESGETPAAVITTVDTVCAACHIAGVADAPKYGDAEAWNKRAEAGIDALVATVVSGKGAMPPKGGTQLTDEEIKQAVEYMLTKQ